MLFQVITYVFPSCIQIRRAVAEMSVKSYTFTQKHSNFLYYSVIVEFGYLHLIEMIYKYLLLRIPMLMGRST